MTLGPKTATIKVELQLIWEINVSVRCVTIVHRNMITQCVFFTSQTETPYWKLIDIDACYYIFWNFITKWHCVHMNIWIVIYFYLDNALVTAVLPYFVSGTAHSWGDIKMHISAKPICWCCAMKWIYGSCRRRNIQGDSSQRSTDLEMQGCIVAMKWPISE